MIPDRAKLTRRNAHFANQTLCIIRPCLPPSTQLARTLPRSLCRRTDGGLSQAPIHVHYHCVPRLWTAHIRIGMRRKGRSLLVSAAGKSSWPRPLKVLSPVRSFHLSSWSKLACKRRPWRRRRPSLTWPVNLFDTGRVYASRTLTRTVPLPCEYRRWNEIGASTDAHDHGEAR